MPTLRRRTAHIQETTRQETTRQVTVVEEEADATDLVYAGALIPDHGAALDPRSWRSQRAAQVQRTLSFLAVRADAFAQATTKAGAPRKVRYRADGRIVGYRRMLVPSSPADDTVRCAANILRARPDASLLEQHHGRLP